MTILIVRREETLVALRRHDNVRGRDLGQSVVLHVGSFRVVSLPGLGTQVAASLEPGAPHAFMLVSGEKGLAFQRRAQPDGLSVSTDGGPGTAPRWLWLSRRGDRFDAYAAVDGGIAHHPALADLAPPGLELRLDQRDQHRARSSQVERRIEHLGEADEAGVADDQVDRLGDMGFGQDARAGLFVDDDTGVLTELPCELVGAAVDRIDARRAAAEQHIGEAAGR